MIFTFEKTAACDIDAQYAFTDYCPAELPVPHAVDIIDQLNQQATFAKYRVGSKDAHSPYANWLSTPDKPVFTPILADNMDCHWPAHAITGTKGFELIAGLPPLSAYDFFVWKGIEPDMHPYGACYHDFKAHLSTGLIEFLQTRGVSCVILGGLATEYCVKVTVLQLLSAGFSVIVNQAACRGLSEPTILSAWQDMQNAGAKLIPHAGALADLLIQ